MFQLMMEKTIQWIKKNKFNIMRIFLISILLSLNLNTVASANDLIFFVESECVDVMPTIDCAESELVGYCNNIAWATKNCAKTCDLCCGIR